MPNGYVVDFKTPANWVRGTVEKSAPFDIYLTRGKAEIILKLHNDALFPLRPHDTRRPFLLAPRYADACKLSLRRWNVHGAEIYETVRPGGNFHRATDRFVVGGKAGQDEFYASVSRPAALELSDVRRALVGVLSSLVVAKNRQPFRSLSIPHTLQTTTPFVKSSLWQVGDVALQLPLGWVPSDMGFPPADLADWSKTCPAVDVIKTGAKVQMYPSLSLEWARARDAKSAFAPFKQKHTTLMQGLSSQSLAHKTFASSNAAKGKWPGVFHRFVRPATRLSEKQLGTEEIFWIYLSDDLAVYAHSWLRSAAYETELQAVVVSVMEQLAKTG